MAILGHARPPGFVPPPPQHQGNPLPLPTPTFRPESSLSSPGDPVAIGPYGTPIVANSEDACVASQGEPPDVAADISPTQIVELINGSGIWISDKQGNVAAGYPELLRAFWAANSPPSGNFLSDTQIAWDPSVQRWLASTLSVTDALDNGDLYFAFSQTSDATGPWNEYKFSNVCSNTQSGNYPLPDQPVVGYNQDWAAVELQCFGKRGVGTGSDQLLLIGSSVLTQSPPPSSLSATTLTPPFLGARPSRDISGAAGKNLYLVGSVVPSSSSLPYVQVTSVNASGSIVSVGFGDVSPGNGVPGTYGKIYPAQHDSCGAGAPCAVNLGDGRITNVIVQKGNDGHVYLLTSFHAGDSANSTAQALWFVAQADTFSTNYPQWNTNYVDGAGWWAGYPTITMDGDLDIAFTFQSFYLNSNIYPNWYISKGFAAFNNSTPELLGYGILANAYRGAYAGCAVVTTRWGDYMSTVWDSNLPSPANSTGFWTVQEYSNGAGSSPGSNESTQITELINPLPYFVSYSSGEAECAVSQGQDCVLNLPAPAGLKNGDVVVAFLDMGGSFPTPPSPPPDKTWVELPIANYSNATYKVSGTCKSGDQTTEYAYAHKYGSSTESGTYKFKHVIYYDCGGAYRPEIEGFAAGYRGASTDFANYLLYGYTNDQLNVQDIVGPAPANAPTLGTLLNIFYLGGYESPESGESGAGYDNLTGTPAASSETPTNGNSGTAYALADVGSTAANTAMNQYWVDSGFPADPDLWGWQLFIPQ